MNNREVPLVDDHEWQAQERGMRSAQERNAGEMDPTADNYRQVALALLSAPRHEPPADFASDIVKRVALQNAGFEGALSRGLFLVLAAAAVIVTALYGGQWWQTMQDTLAGGVPEWILAGVGCMALSWMINQLRQLTKHAAS